jgi:hypothetical protein
MSTTEDFGLVTWDESVEFKQRPKRQEGKDNWMRLEQGSNVVRIVTKPHQYWYHKYKEQETDPGFGDKIMCSKFHGSCPLCDAKVRRSRRWFVGVIDRRTQSYKILDMSRTIYQNIQKFSRDEDYGDPGRYDVDIVVDKNAGPQGWYTVIPKPPKPLSQEDVAIKQGLEVQELIDKCSPPEPERVQATIEAVNKRNAAKRGGPPAQAKAAAPAASTSEDEDYDFKKIN